MLKIYEESISGEIYQVKLEESTLFGEYIGQSFKHAAHMSFSKNVVFLGIKDEKTHEIHLNPGSKYILVFQVDLNDFLAH